MTEPIEYPQIGQYVVHRYPSGRTWHGVVWSESYEDETREVVIRLRSRKQLEEDQRTTRALLARIEQALDEWTVGADPEVSAP